MNRFLVFTLILVGLEFSIAPAALSQSDYQVVTVSNPGTIKGSVKWKGAVPSPLTLPISKNPEVCDPESQKVRNLERLIVGPTAGVANTVVYLKNISQGKPLEIPQQFRSLDQRTCRYQPHILLVPLNGELDMKSSDPLLHNVHMSGGASYNLPFPIKDQVISRTMHQAGLISISCNAGHVWMNGEILVVPHPYYTVTDESGNFELTDVPPGDYEIEAWHEGWHIAREEVAYDVTTQQKVKRPIFSDPLAWDSNVTVAPSATQTVNFEISESNGHSARP